VTPVADGRLRYRVDPTVDPAFRADYERTMLAACGADDLPNPHGARHGIFHNYRPWEYAKVFAGGRFRPEDVVLDTGALHTYFCVYVSRFVGAIHVSDNFYWASRGYITRQRLFTPEQWVAYVEQKGGGKLRGEAADLTTLPYADATFDKVLCISTIEHVKDDVRGIRELARVLKPGGRLLLTTEFNPFRGKPYTESDNSFYRVYTRRRLGELVAESGLAPDGDALLEKRNWLLARKHVNVFLALRK
jgi:SAM-dependent methyltransferase